MTSITHMTSRIPRPRVSGRDNKSSIICRGLGWLGGGSDFSQVLHDLVLVLIDQDFLVYDQRVVSFLGFFLVCRIFSLIKLSYYFKIQKVKILFFAHSNLALPVPYISPHVYNIAIFLQENGEPIHFRKISRYFQTLQDKENTVT